MTRIRTCLAIAPLVLSACATSSHTAPEVRIFNADLRAAFDNLERSLSEPRTPLALPSGETISTCRGYLRHVDSIDRDHPDRMTALQDYVICDSVVLLQRARPVSAAPVDVGQALATRLDVRTFPSSLGPRANEQTFSIEALAGEPLVIEANAAMLDSDAWYLRVERVAAADFDGDGREDWLVWIGDDSGAGSYQAFQALLVHDATQPGTLTGAPLP